MIPVRLEFSELRQKMSLVCMHEKQHQIETETKKKFYTLKKNCDFSTKSSYVVQVK